MSTKLILKVYNCLKNVQFVLLPSVCIVCDSASLTNIQLCSACDADLPYLKNPCQNCSLPIPEGKHSMHLCGACLSNAPPFRYSVSVFEYKSPINRLIIDFKEHGKLYNGRTLAQLLSINLKSFYGDKTLPDFIIPTPLHSRRLRKRGYNQAAELCRHLSSILNIPMQLNLCVRQRDSIAQRGLSAKERKNNLVDAFNLPMTNTATHIKGKTIAIVDDVVTTMSTVKELSKTLIIHGAKEIHIWSIARACK